MGRRQRSHKRLKNESNLQMKAGRGSLLTNSPGVADQRALSDRSSSSQTRSTKVKGGLSALRSVNTWWVKRLSLRAKTVLIVLSALQVLLPAIVLPVRALLL